MSNYDICVFGSCSCDINFFQKSDGTYNTYPNMVSPGGKGANQAVAASRAGAKVILISKIGKNKIGKNILENLLNNEVITKSIELVEGIQNNFSKIYINNETKDNKIISLIENTDAFSVEMIEKNKNIILNSKIVISQTKVPKKVYTELINFCDKNNIPIIVNPSVPQKLKISDDKNLELINKISYIIVNEKEFSVMFENQDINECVKRYPNKLIVTLGKNGVIYHDGNKIQKIDAITNEKVIDTTGAGDTFIGNFAASIIKENNLSLAINNAQFAASMKLLKPTAQEGMPYSYELEKYILNHNIKNFKYENEFKFMYENVKKASSLIKEKIINTSKKSDKTFVTESDLLIEDFLVNKIRSIFPKDNIISEEQNSIGIIKNRTWIIDPIDGTHHYMKKSLFWGIQVAFIDQNQTQFSVVYIPKLNEMYYALNGIGTFMNHQKIIASNNITFDKCIVEICGSIHKLFEEKIDIFKKITLAEEKVANIMHINSSCMAFTNIVAGRTDVLVLSAKKIWDIVPGILILKEMGIEPISYGNLQIFSNSIEFNRKLGL